jgi:hypothetical protein
MTTRQGCCLHACAYTYIATVDAGVRIFSKTKKKMLVSDRASPRVGRARFIFFTITTYIILKQHNYIKTLKEEVIYNKIPRSRSRCTTGEQDTGELQRH